MEVAEQNVSIDTSACYEDYTPNLNENVDAEWPACKKRKIHAQEKAIQEDIVKEKPILVNNNNGCRKSPQNEQQNDNPNHDQHYGDALALTTHIQPPNLSDSDSNDAFPTIIPSNKELVYMLLINIF